MKNIKIFLFLLMTVALLLTACGKPAPAATETPVSITLAIGSGSKGGVFYPYGAGLARILSENMPGVTATSIETAGSVDNMQYVQNGKAQIGFATVDSAFDAIQGYGAYSESGRVSARALAVLYTSFVHIMVSDASGIQSIKDMKGKFVSIGDSGSSTEGAAERILEIAGVDPKTGIKRQNLSFGDAIIAMSAGKIDAFFWIGGLPINAIKDMLAAGTQAHFIDASAYVKPLATKYGSVYRAFTLPKDIYGTKTDIPGIGVDNILFVSESMPEEQAYQILTTIFAHLDEVHKLHPQAASLTLADAPLGSSIPFHPGAIRFYTERDVWK